MKTPCLLILLFCCIPLTGAESPPSFSDKLTTLIAALDSESFEVRETAMRALIQAGPAAVEPLKKAIASSKSAEIKSRGARVLAYIDGGGVPVNGLKVTLSASKDALKMGDSLKLTTTLRNLTGTPLNVHVGYSPVGYYFENGLGFCRTSLDPVTLKAMETRPDYRGFVCGTGARTLFVAIPAHGSVEYKSEVTLLPPSKDRPAEGTCLGFGKTPAETFAMLPVDGAPVQRLQVSYNVTSEQNQETGFGGGAPTFAQPGSPFWTGTVHSNFVDLKVTPDKAP